MVAAFWRRGSTFFLTARSPALAFFTTFLPMDETLDARDDVVVFEVVDCSSERLRFGGAILFEVSLKDVLCQLLF